MHITTYVPTTVCAACVRLYYLHIYANTAVCIENTFVTLIIMMCIYVHRYIYVLTKTTFANKTTSAYWLINPTMSTYT